MKAGEEIAVLDAPELGAQKAEAQSKLQSAEAQLGAARSKAEATWSRSDKLKAASATPGVVAGNDVVVAEKAAADDQVQIAAAHQNVEATRQALTSVGTWKRTYGSQLRLPASSPSATCIQAHSWVPPEAPAPQRRS